MLTLGVSGRDRRVAVKAEALLAAGVVGVVPRGADGAEGVADLAPDDGVDRAEGAGDRESETLPVTAIRRTDSTWSRA